MVICWSPEQSLALQFGVFSEAGLEPRRGALVQTTPTGPVTVVDRLTTPTGLEVVPIDPLANVLIASISEGTLTIYRINTAAL